LIKSLVNCLSLLNRSSRYKRREPDRLIYEKVIPLMQSTFGI
jgi:hypothetical protein